MIALPNFEDPAEAAMAWAKEYKEKKVLAIENKRLEDENVMLAAENQELKHDKNYLDLIMRSRVVGMPFTVSSCKVVPSLTVTVKNVASASAVVGASNA